MRTESGGALVAGILAAVLLAAHVLAPGAVLRESAWTLLAVGACAGVLVGIRRFRPSVVGPWRLVALGLGLLALGNLANHPVMGPPSWAGPFSQLAELVAFPMFAVSAHAMARRQAPNGDREGAIDGAIVMVALFTALAGTVFGGDTVQVTTGLSRTLIIVAPLLLAAVSASVARLVFVGARVFSTYALAAASLSALLGHVLRTLAQSAGTYERGSWDDVFIGAAYAAVGLAGLHPSMTRLTEVRAHDDRRLTLARLGVLGLSLVTPPVSLLLHDEAHALPLVGSVVVSLLVLWRLWRLVMEREAVRDEMRHRSVHDGLTGLPNRGHLLDRLGRALRDSAGRGGKTAVLFIDLDGFKQVNDDFGHRVGDETLLAVVERLRRVVRDQDLLGRLAGDEFVVVCEDVDESVVVPVAARIMDAFADPFKLAAVEVGLGASIGIAIGGAEATPEQLLHEADAAMYHGKQRGGGSIELFGEELGTRLRRRRRLEADLPAAVDEGSLQLVYQPILDLGLGAGPAGTMAGAEVLLRWDHPELGPVDPGELIRIADASGAVVGLGAWVLREACRQLTRWRREGAVPAGFRIFVNVSSRQLLHARLPDDVVEVIRSAGAAPSDVVVEVTETAVIDDDGLPARVCRALRQQGVAIALDDFGTGYSSLTHLKRLPIDFIKIDATFVEDLRRSGDDQAIVSAIVSIAGQLGAKVVGEGVESEAQLGVLRRLGCDYAQGYHLGLPQDASSLHAPVAVEQPR